MFRSVFSPQIPWRLTSIAALGLLLVGCDHAKDLVEQGKKQAADIQKSLEGKTAESSSTGSSSTTEPASSSSASPTTPAPAASLPPTPAAQAADPGALIDAFLKCRSDQRTDGMLHDLAALPESFRVRVTECD